MIAECADDPTLAAEVLAMLEEDGRASSVLDRDVSQSGARDAGR